MSEPQGKIRVAEIFYSLQGEGAYQGTPSIFLRVFGCNFKCQGFGMPKGQLSNEYLTIDPEEQHSYNKLPLVHTGCDSYASWDHRFKHLSPWMTIDEIVAKIKSLLPNGVFTDDIHLIITGGEPLLPGWQREYPALFMKLYGEKMVEANRSLQVTFETNGTQKLDSVLATAMSLHNVMFSVSSKLPSSGEPWETAINPEAVRTYQSWNWRGYFKWVLSNPEDQYDVERAIKAYADWGVRLPVYVMPAGGTTQGYEANKKWVAELALAKGWRYSPRLQVDLWKNAWGT